ncbi:MAG: sigma-54 dependent transcriptional regulator [Candidatus Sulfotelmatobacter sp.]
MSALTVFPSLASIAGGAVIASPSGAFREQVVDRLNGRCRPLQQALGGADALAKLEKGDWQLLFLDRQVSDLETGELIAIIQKRFPGIQVVLLDSASGAANGSSTNVTSANISAPGFPASSFSPPSFSSSKLTISSPVLGNPNPIAPGEAVGIAPLPGMIGRSQAMQRVYRLARLVAPRSTTVLIAGATGSGKELVARALHRLSPRAGKTFVAVNCAAIPETLLESELFGHVKGAFTGAVQAQVGRIPAAHGGTLFLDEVSELPLGMQAKLLRFLEEKEVQRLGTSEVSRVDVRVVAASNADLAGRAERGEFREDLFYRLAAFPLELPPLAERREDILPLAEHFLACMAAAIGGVCPRLHNEAAAVLENHEWRGNVRELQHVMERASILVENGDTVHAEHLYFPFQYPQAQPASRCLSCSGLAS